MQVIDTDNYDRDYVADRRVAGPGLAKEEAERIANELNAERGQGRDWWAIVVPDDHKLKSGEP